MNVNMGFNPGQPQVNIQQMLCPDAERILKKLVNSYGFDPIQALNHALICYGVLYYPDKSGNKPVKKEGNKHD